MHKKSFVSSFVSFALLCVLSVIVGCSQDIATGSSAMPGSNAYFDKISVQQAFETAKKALSQYYKIDSVDKQRLVIVSRPEEYASKKSESSLADTVSPVIGPSRKAYRRVATVKVRQSASGRIIVTVRVEIQRRDTETMRTFAYQRQAEDRPSEIPVEQTAVRTGSAYDVWTTVKRDYNQERAILKTLRELLGNKR